MTIQQITKINNLPLDKLKGYVGQLDDCQKTHVNRILTPSKMNVLFSSSKRFIFSWGGRGGGKSLSIAKWLLYLGSREKIRILCTREIQDSIKDSVHTLLSDLVNELNYNNYIVTDKTIKHVNGSEFIFSGLYRQDKKQSIKSMANIAYCWVEESQAVSKGSLDVLVPTIRKQGSRIIFSFNRLFPDDPVFRFMESLEDKDKECININYSDNQFLPEELRRLAEISRKQYENKENEDYLHIWRGEPVGFSERTVLKLRDIQSAINREIDDNGAEVVGVDVARFGNDNTVMIKRKGLKMMDYKIYNKLNTVEVAKRTIDFINNNTAVKVLVDATGVGGGVADYLRQDGFNVVDINFGGSAKDSDKYNNIISEMWFEFRDMLDTVSLIDIPDLKSQLCTREFKMDNKERRCIESKDDYKKRGFKSPDIADACLMTFYNTGYNDESSFTRGIF